MPKGVRTRSQSQVAKGKSRTSSTAKSPSSKSKGENKAEKSLSSAKSKRSKSSNNGKTNKKRPQADSTESENVEPSSSASDGSDENSEYSSPSSVEEKKKKKRPTRKSSKRKCSSTDESSQSMALTEASSISEPSIATNSRSFGNRLEKLSKAIVAINDKMKVYSFTTIERRTFFKKTFKELKQVLMENKRSIKRKRMGNKSWDHMFDAWLLYAEEFPDKKNAVCLDTHSRLNNWVKEQRRKCSENTLSQERYQSLIAEGFVFAPRKLQARKANVAPISNDADGLPKIPPSTLVALISKDTDEVPPSPHIAPISNDVDDIPEVPPSTHAAPISNDVDDIPKVQPSTHDASLSKDTDEVPPIPPSTCLAPLPAIPEEGAGKSPLSNEIGVLMESAQEAVKPLSNSVEVTVDSVHEKVVPLSNSVVISVDSVQEKVVPLSNSVEVTVDSVHEKVVPLSHSVAVKMQSVEGDVLPPLQVVDNPGAPLSPSRRKKSKKERKRGSSNTDDEVVQSMKRVLRPRNKKVVNSEILVDGTTLDATIALTADKEKKTIIDTDEIDNPPPSSDAKQALFPFSPGISAEHKLDFLLSSPFVNEQFSKQCLVAMFVDDEKDDYPLLYVDIRRYQVNGWMSNHFVSAYFYLLRKRFNNKHVKFLDTSFWSNYITEPDSSDSVTQGAWVAKVKRVLNTYNISDGDAIYIPALVNENHFILLYINVREREIKVFDPLGLRNDSAINTLVNLLQTVYQLSSWKIEDNINMLLISRQTDMHSCAFYVCFYAYQHALTGSLQLKYGTAILKKRIMLSLVQRELIPLHTDLTLEEDAAINQQRNL